MKFHHKKLIIWDWNGTLLNDAQVCVDCMNTVLKRRKFSGLTIERYRDIFTFPVKEYYLKAGFDFTVEDFEKPANEFIDLYYREVERADLFPCVKDALQTLSERGMQQLVLSAMEHGQLETTLEAKGIKHFFDRVSGLQDHYAHSKLEIGKELLQQVNGTTRDEMLLIGDSLHDLEVAAELGVDCALVSNGHQSKNRLLAETEFVFEKLADLVEAIEKG